METDKDNIVKIEEAFVSAYRRKSTMPMAAGLRQDIMRHIRGIPRSDDGAQELFDSRTLWKFAATACFAAAIIFIYAFQSDMSGEYEITRLLGDDFLIVSAFGLL